MESSSSSTSLNFLSYWNYLNFLLFRPVLAVLFVLSFIILWFCWLIILFSSLFFLLECINKNFKFIGWLLAWKLVLVHVPLVQEIFGLRKKPVKPKPPTRRLSRYYNSINSHTSTSQ
ncbi:hypothetical protein Gotri_010612 [Gossypium trilobum]|uniref:Uncharacterized protein n=1 Tax=Gossypium trilobum TaxID=34281 RepID=A0A7J9EQZ8_9ROSI|nr:hypothetical protein [Gossypium trilobum]